ncbi:helix-turn-helix transcriptional regulator [Pseudomonas aeruginosa]|uniref:helix-turn-helix transcriptional regulator n=1 Tax=Pseudomonas TaxID=286 RepID=UPI001CD59E36|nr:helix-turn-helix transcriptional regulator [Pseudomonas aeruginosa]MCS9641424.1 helix-turn-helix domain-containing protein [Pseudomonas aeruginosa]MCT5586926.1 helix-turn-helix domain-containing protein [Pseudomonas aeruginosa]MDI2218186.1 helix-turn-helix domain-containing protein [Pseudomonas aeruginosa]MDU0737439.1 helix-turn-helix transcriptional regulator [Pseudomonas aeruginosa]
MDEMLQPVLFRATHGMYLSLPLSNTKRIFKKDHQRRAAMSALKAARKQAGLTQTELAKSVGLTQGAITHYETGRRTPELNLCRRIVAALNAGGSSFSLEDVFPEPEAGAERLAS